MLRLRLFFGLITLILILWGVGGAALLLLRETSKPFDLRMQQDYRVITAAHNLRAGTVLINSHYLVGQAGIDADHPTDRSLFIETKSQLANDLEIITADAHPDEQWKDQVAALRNSLDAYFTSYEQLFALDSSDPDDRTPVLGKISALTLQLSQITKTMMEMAEGRISTGTNRFAADAGKNTLFMVTLLGFGTAIAVFIYFQLVKHLVTPVTSLHQSIEDIRNGNFESMVPSPAHGSEFAVVANAFNDMAAELKIRRGESNEKLQRANQINRAILEAIPSPVFLVGDDNTIVQVNRPAAELTESLGVSGGLPTNIQHLLDECRKTHTHFLPQEPQNALRFQTSDHETYYLPRIFRVGADGSSQSGWAILLHNVSRIRWLDHMKSHLLATASHEIMTPLTSIRMALLLLLEERLGPLTAKQRELTLSANGDCVRLLNTLNNLLDLSRAEIGSIDLSLKPLAARHCVERAIQLFSVVAANRGIEFRIDDGLAQSPPLILADPIRLDVVLNNLVSNAIKHSPEGSEVVLRLSNPDPGYIRISVIDQGPGVPAASQSHIFERFYRAPGENGQGTGLGLFIAREIMEAHNGRIGLMERSGDTTEFYIDIPVA